MRMLRQAAALATTAGFIVSAHAAGMTYLDCTVVDSSGDKTQFVVGLDETAARANHSGGKQHVTVPAIFAMDTITYKINESLGSMRLIRQYSINHDDLSVTHLFRAEATDRSLGVAPSELTMRGTCTKATPKKRQI